MPAAPATHLGRMGGAGMSGLLAGLLPPPSPMKRMRLEEGAGAAPSLGAGRRLPVARACLAGGCWPPRLGLEGGLRVSPLALRMRLPICFSSSFLRSSSTCSGREVNGVCSRPCRAVSAMLHKQAGS
jgi:hypothetical protein